MSAEVNPTEASRPYEDVFRDAVRVLTEAARRTRPVLASALTYQAGADSDGAAASPSRPGAVETGPREPGDFAEFVTQALVAAAANVGGVETVLAGRPGSWEADAARSGSTTRLSVGSTDPPEVRRASPGTGYNASSGPSSVASSGGTPVSTRWGREKEYDCGSTSCACTVRRSSNIAAGRW